MSVIGGIAFIAVTILGVNTLLWGAVGAARSLSWRRAAPGQHGFHVDEVAVLIPAHNEQDVIADSLRAALALFRPADIHVVSDGSQDATVAIAESLGVNVYDLQPNRGKAGALLAAVEHFGLARRYKVLLLLDADTRLAPDYLSTGLPLFDDPEVVAVAGRVRCQLDPPPRTLVGRVLLGYRARLYAVTQLVVKYGQASRWANAVTIVPGFASMYRTDVLRHIDITAPNLVIEDFNMTFETHAKGLGRIAFHPSAAVAYTQDPDNWGDYYKQVRRWTLGYWQTVRRHGFHVGRFWAALTLQVIELVSASAVVLSMLPIMIFTVYSDFLAPRYGDPTIFGYRVVGTLEPHYALIGFLLPDLLLTVFAALALKRPSLLALAPLFPILRFVEAWICLRCIPAAWRTKSTGRWISPQRRGHTTEKQGGILA